MSPPVEIARDPLPQPTIGPRSRTPRNLFRPLPILGRMTQVVCIQASRFLYHASPISQERARGWRVRNRVRERHHGGRSCRHPAWRSAPYPRYHPAPRGVAGLLGEHPAPPARCLSGAGIKDDLAVILDLTAKSVYETDFARSVTSIGHESRAHRHARRRPHRGFGLARRSRARHPLQAP